MHSKQLLALGVLVAAACSDGSQPTSPRSIAPSVSSADRSATGAFRRSDRYVAIGTSITMGWASDGVYFGSQLASFPQLLGIGSLKPISLPLIQAPGCRSPLIAPLGLGKRLSGESAAGSIVCAPNAAGVTLPTQNLGLSGAIALDIVQTTPETAPPTEPWFARVLPPHTTAMAAALVQRPTFVSVELGANEVLGAISGLVGPGTVVPFPIFMQPYDLLLNTLGAVHPRAVLIGLPSDARNLPALRRGDEIWADRAEFAALHVDVSADCQNSQNWITVAIKSLNMVFAGAAASAAHLPNPVFSCADVPGVPDLVLTPSDIAVVNGLLAQMTAHVQQQAAARGYAYASLGTLYDRADLKGGAYSVVKQLTSAFPYGAFVSLDGVHPNAIGNGVLALAAAQAIGGAYGSDAVHTLNVPTLPSLADLTRELTPSEAMAMAQRVASGHAGEQLEPCSRPGGCRVR